MKKLALFISGITLVFASCQKVSVQPNAGDANAEPTWEMKSRSVNNSGGSEEGQDPEGNPIVDPNDDEDGHGKRKV